MHNAPATDVDKNLSRLFGLIGSPLSHSFSERYFTNKFSNEGLVDCAYRLFPLSSIKELPLLLQRNPLLKGLNVTIPYKKAVLPFLATTEHLPAGLEACNCIRIDGSHLVGYNTDVTGFEKTLTPLLKTFHKKALILGNGGAAAAVAFVLKKLGIEFHVVSRTIHDGSTLTYKQLSNDIVEENKLIINTTPLGTYPEVDDCPAIPYAAISADHLLYDLIYNPAKSLFLLKGEERGAVIKNGEEMLVEQAEESWRIWNQ